MHCDLISASCPAMVVEAAGFIRGVSGHATPRRTGRSHPQCESSFRLSVCCTPYFGCEVLRCDMMSNFVTYPIASCNLHVAHPAWCQSSIQLCSLVKGNSNIYSWTYLVICACWASPCSFICPWCSHSEPLSTSTSWWSHVFKRPWTIQSHERRRHCDCVCPL